MERTFVTFTGTTFAEQDTEVCAAGTAVGFDEVTITPGTTANTTDIGFALNGGLLDGTLTISRSTGAATGAVTRGPVASRARPGRSPARA